MERTHRYQSQVTWTGNRGSGTLDYRAYSRDHRIEVDGKNHPIEASSDPLFRGDREKYNPEELFLSSLSSCHMLWYLHLAAVNGIVVLDYQDRAEGTMHEADDGSGKFTGVALHPTVKIADPEKIGTANALHREAGEKCFLASSVNFRIMYYPTTSV
ncbi:organic hydroperoxide reductase OsmC/OhrA [Neolewinella xylanilytica]|uniref:Organic hydroperoxide reductase OsmC/OhrA n=1 Tax=Neolewinella xylanilytica TaxID=1514080 RepID=A0A2S6I3A1_9BACT|nr:OsmC family protein [Neolewinella xylanilytica]PPK85662.1 organic hydroperoxide reductase OsmC/OhrA [Neolewinella xylanilytica]